MSDSRPPSLKLTPRRPTASLPDLACCASWQTQTPDLTTLVRESLVKAPGDRLNQNVLGSRSDGELIVTMCRV